MSTPTPPPARGELRSLDDYVWGPDGDPTKGMVGKIKEVWARAKETPLQDAKGEPLKDDAGKVRYVERVAIVGNLEGLAGDSRQFSNTAVTASQVSPEQLAGQIRNQLELEPGATFCGQIRFYFRAEGNSAINLGSYTRSIRPAILGALPDGQAAGNAAAIYATQIAPMQDRLLLAMDKQTAMVDASGRLFGAVAVGVGVIVQTFKRTVEAPVAEGGGLMSLVGTALKIAGVAGVPGAAQGSQVLQAGKDAVKELGVSPRDMPRLEGPGGSPDLPSLDASTPAASSSSPSPSSPSSKVDRAAVDAWARENPDEAKAMVRQAMREGGAPDMMIALVK